MAKKTVLHSEIKGKCEMVAKKQECEKKSLLPTTFSSVLRSLESKLGNKSDTERTITQ